MEYTEERRNKKEMSYQWKTTEVREIRTQYTWKPWPGTLCQQIGRG